MIEIKSRINNNSLMLIYDINKLEEPFNFISKEQHPLQIGFFNFNKSHKVHPHKHVDNIKKTSKTNEAWLIVKGIFEIEVYDFDKSIIFKDDFNKHHLFIYYDGYHSIKAKSKLCKLLEFRNGPYLGRENETIKL